jgi:uncharacterized protein (DUF58 family)
VNASSVWDRLRGAVTGARPASSGGASETLFDDDFQRKLDSLAMVSRRVFRGRMRADRRTKKTGSGVEFAEHRGYEPGDDFRSLDWNVYQRLDRLLVRLFEEEEDLSIYLIVDSSRSMGFGDGEKFRYARRVAAALAYVGLANLDRVTLVSTADKVMKRMPETRGKARIFRVFRFLDELRADGSTNLFGELKTFAAAHRRRGLVVLISDLYDPKGFEEGINVLRYNKFDVLVVHVTSKTDARPELYGDVTLVDCETGEPRDVTVSSKVLSDYERVYEAYLTNVERFCKAKQVSYLRASTEVPVHEFVLHAFKKGGLLR